MTCERHPNSGDRTFNHITMCEECAQELITDFMNSGNAMKHMSKAMSKVMRLSFQVCPKCASVYFDAHPKNGCDLSKVSEVQDS